MPHWLVCLSWASETNAASSSQKVRPLCVPCPFSFPYTISKACFHGVMYFFFFLICFPPAKITLKWMPPHWLCFITGNTTINGSCENPASQLPSQFSFHRDTVFHFAWKILECFEFQLLNSKKAILQSGQEIGCILFLHEKKISTECNRFTARGN